LKGDLRNRLHVTLFKVYQELSDSANPRPPTKGEVLAETRRRYPELEDKIPTSDKGINLMWKDARLQHLEQSRGLGGT
jgi:hypothetical protein